MTQDEIIRMAREAGFVFPETQEDSFTCWWEELERFAALVAEPWIETNKALAKELIELKKEVKQEPVKACVSGVCPNRANCDAAQSCLYTEAETVKQEPVARHICNLWVDPATKQYVVDHCDHPIDELIPAYSTNQYLNKEPDYWLGYGLQAYTQKPFEGATPLYAAPVDAKAIRAEALEEAAKVCEEYALESMEAFNRTGHDFEDGQVNGGYGCAAAIRSLR